MHLLGNAVANARQKICCQLRSLFWGFFLSGASWLVATPLDELQQGYSAWAALETWERIPLVILGLAAALSYLFFAAVPPGYGPFLSA